MRWLGPGAGPKGSGLEGYFALGGSREGGRGNFMYFKYNFSFDT